jgi:hypothetical protein
MTKSKMKITILNITSSDTGYPPQLFSQSASGLVSFSDPPSNLNMTYTLSNGGLGYFKEML